MEQSVWRIHAEFYGVKKRGRKADRHSSVGAKATECLAELPGDTKPDELEHTARTLAPVWIKANAKNINPLVAGGQAAWATATLWRIDGSMFQQWRPFEKDENLKWQVEVLL